MTTEMLNNQLHANDPQYFLSKLREKMDKADCDGLVNAIDGEQLFHISYVPFVIARLVWEYVDSILNMACYLKLKETRKLSAAIKELHKDYNDKHAKSVDDKHIASEFKNMEVYEDGVEEITAQMLVNLRADIQREYPELSSDYVAFIVAVYQADILLQALLRYTSKQMDKICKIIKRPVARSIMHIHMFKLAKLIPLYVGDKPVSKRFEKMKEQYINTLANQIGLVTMTETKTA